MSKYKAKLTYIDGVKFDSKKESTRYLQLKCLLDAGVITNLELQPRFDFKINGKLMFYYKADFEYCKNGERIIEDVKGFKTPIYRLKKKIIEATHNIKIMEV